MIIDFKKYKFHVYCDLFKHEMLSGLSQPFESDIKNIENFLNSTRRNKIMIDVGAHIGLFSIIYSKYFDKIYAFEPNIKSYNYLLKNIKLNKCKNIEPYNFAVSNDLKTGNIESYGNPENSGTFKLKPGNSIKCIKIDDFFTEADFIKIDTEDYDFNVLQSSRNLLINSRPFLQVERLNNEEVEYLNKIGYQCIDSLHDSFFNGHINNRQFPTAVIPVFLGFIQKDDILQRRKNFCT